MFPSNVHILTRSHNAIARKKHARRNEVKEVIFDDDARRYVSSLHLSSRSQIWRREFLTGFHKRKKAKADAARKKAIERERQERLEARREVRSAG